MKQLVVAIDGPSGSGKSSTSRQVAKHLGLDYLDTGAMYRAMAYVMLRDGVDVDDPVAVGEHARSVQIVSGTDPANPTIAVGESDVSHFIRTDEVTSAVSPVAAVAAVRTQLVELQRQIIANSDGIVVEGRDIGSVVAPQAQIKIYLVADPQARARRRTAEQGGSDTAATAQSLARRDELDSTRAISPLTFAEGAVVVDSTHLTLNGVVNHIVEIVQSR